MAKKNEASCPLCSWKGDPGGNQYPPHLDGDGNACLMSTRPVPEREAKGPVTDGSGPSGSIGGPTGTPVQP